MKNDLGAFRAQIEACISKNECVIIDPTSDQQDAIDMFVVFKRNDDG